MDQTLEITARSLEEATQQAAKQLKVSPQDIAVQVLEQSKGLFGRGSVRIRAIVVNPAAAPQVEAPAPAAEPTPEPEAPTAPKKSEKLFGKATRRSPKAEPAPEAPVAEAPAPEKKAARPPRAAKAAPKEEAEEKPAAEEESSVVATVEDANRLTGYLKSFVEGADLDLSVVQKEPSGKYVTIEVDGRDSSYLVGKHGEVLNALQYLMNMVAHQQIGTGVRVTLDCNNWRKAREDKLTKYAETIADQVRQRGEEAVLDALPAFERRVIHKALSEFKGVVTYSEGEEPNRRVVIAPAE